MSEYAWPLVALVGLGAAYRFGARFIPAAGEVAAFRAELAALYSRVLATEGLKSEMTDALETAHAMTLKLAEIDDRIGVMEMRAGLGQ